MTAKKLLGAYLRSVTGHLALGVVWLVVGTALASVSLGIALSALTLFVLPWALPIGAWLVTRSRGRLRRVAVGSDPALAHDFFAGFLREPGPRPELWSRPAADRTVAWFQHPFKPGVQVVIVSTGWLLQDASTRSQDFRALWTKLAQTSAAEARLRNLRIALWVGSLAPAAFLLSALDLLLAMIGLSQGLPGVGFWFQRVLWSLRGLWFQEGDGAPDLVLRGDSNPRRVSAEPTVWHSVLWGPWFQMPLREAHPSWPLLTHRDAFY